MGFWVELQCVSDFEPVNWTGRPACWSSRGDDIGMLFRDATHLKDANRMLSAEAKAQGWEKRKSGWWCPCCIAEGLRVIENTTTGGKDG